MLRIVYSSFVIPFLSFRYPNWATREFAGTHGWCGGSRHQPGSRPRFIRLRPRRGPVVGLGAPTQEFSAGSVENGEPFSGRERSVGSSYLNIKNRLILGMSIIPGQQACIRVRVSL